MGKQWLREDDLALVEKIYAGRTAEGLTVEMGLTQSQLANRLRRLGLTIRTARKAKRDGVSAVDFLDTSHIYRKPVPKADLFEKADDREDVESAISEMKRVAKVLSDAKRDIDLVTSNLEWLLKPRATTF